jgi:hypothetical protein
MYMHFLCLVHSAEIQLVQIYVHIRVNKKLFNLIKVTNSAPKLNILLLTTLQVTKKKQALYICVGKEHFSFRVCQNSSFVVIPNRGKRLFLPHILLIKAIIFSKV